MPQADPAVAVIRDQAVAFIRDQAEQPVTVADIADAVGYSEFHFTRLFAGSVGVSPGRYLAAVRFQRAKELLLTEQMPVVDVCHAVGYNSPGTFTRRFTAEVGVSPAALRRVADRLAGPALHPFHRDPAPIPAPHPAQTLAPLTVTVEIGDELRPELGDDPLVWVGLFPRPVPAGPPLAGVLRFGDGQVRLPVIANAPWLLATAVRAQADPLEHLVPSRPVVGGHPNPVRGGQLLTIRLRRADAFAHPLLVALASLAPT